MICPARCHWSGDPKGKWEYLILELRLVLKKETQVWVWSTRVIWFVFHSWRLLYSWRLRQSRVDQRANARTAATHQTSWAKNKPYHPCWSNPYLVLNQLKRTCSTKAKNATWNLIYERAFTQVMLKCNKYFISGIKNITVCIRPIEAPAWIFLARQNISSFVADCFIQQRSTSCVRMGFTQQL